MLPVAVAIEINADCNRSCSWCPRHEYGRGPGRLSEPLYQKILEGLKRSGFNGRLTFSIYNEPLTDGRLIRFVAIARRILPAAFVYLSTNGDSLTVLKWQELRKAGVGSALVSQYDGKINPNVQAVIDSLDSKELERFDVRVFTPGMICNRAGLIESGRKLPLFKSCCRPFMQLSVNYKGEAIICCNDYLGKVVAGNLRTDSIESIWNGGVFGRYRIELAAGRRAGLELCRVCDM